MQKYIVFDFDGTLVDSQNIFVPIYNQIAEKHGYKTVREEEIEHLRKLTMPERCKKLDVPLYKLPILALEFYKLYQPAIKDLVLFHGMKDVLDELHKKATGLPSYPLTQKSIFERFYIIMVSKIFKKCIVLKICSVKTK